MYFIWGSQKASGNSKWAPSGGVNEINALWMFSLVHFYRRQAILCKVLEGAERKELTCIGKREAFFVVNLHRHSNLFFNVFSKSTADIPHTQPEHLSTNQVTKGYTVQIHKVLGEFMHIYLTLMWNSICYACNSCLAPFVCFLGPVWDLKI